MWHVKLGNKMNKFGNHRPNSSLYILSEGIILRKNRLCEDRRGEILEAKGGRKEVDYAHTGDSRKKTISTHGKESERRLCVDHSLKVHLEHCRTVVSGGGSV